MSKVLEFRARCLQIKKNFTEMSFYFNLISQDIERVFQLGSMTFPPCSLNNNLDKLQFSSYSLWKHRYTSNNILLWGLGLDCRTHLNLRYHKIWRFGTWKLKFRAKCQTLWIYHVFLSNSKPQMGLYLRQEDSGYYFLKVYW